MTEGLAQGGTGDQHLYGCCLEPGASRQGHRAHVQTKGTDPTGIEHPPGAFGHLAQNFRRIAEEEPWGFRGNRRRLFAGTNDKGRFPALGDCQKEVRFLETEFGQLPCAILGKVLEGFYGTNQGCVPAGHEGNHGVWAIIRQPGLPGESLKGKREAASGAAAGNENPPAPVEGAPHGGNHFGEGIKAVSQGCHRETVDLMEPLDGDRQVALGKFSESGGFGMGLFRHQFAEFELIAYVQKGLQVHLHNISRCPACVESFQPIGIAKAIDLACPDLRACLVMLLVSTALMLEARPLVRRLGLRAHSCGKMTAYEGDTAVLVVTGTGSIRAAAATGWAMARFPDIRHALNIGFAGAGPRTADVHTWHLINRIRDRVSGRLLLPDVLYKHPFPEASLLTVPEIVREPLDWEGLVDMEGSGFYEAARQFLGPDRIALLKWVSDPLTGRIDPAETERAFADGLEAAVEFMDNWPCPGELPASPHVEALLGEINERLRLTRTQSEFVGKWVSGYLARGGDPERLRAVLPGCAPRIKEDNKRVFNRLKDVLKN